MAICCNGNITIFTARCTLVQSAVLRSHVVCLSACLSVRLSVTLVDCDHIGWNSSEIILFATQTSRVYSKGNTLKFSPEQGWGAEKVAFGVQKLYRKTSNIIRTFFYYKIALKVRGAYYAQIQLFLYLYFRLKRSSKTIKLPITSCIFKYRHRPTVDQGSSVLLVHVSVFDHRSSLLLSPPRGRRMVAGGETCELNVTQ